MNFYISLVRFLFILFLIYTVGYIFHWLLGMLAALTRLSEIPGRKELVRYALDDSLARDVPVTVIVPAHNEEACIVSTVEALLREDYPALQVLVVDDGSSDGTRQALLDAFALEPAEPVPCGSLPTAPVKACYTNRLWGISLTLICKENGGKADALNCGLNYCPDAYCLIVDADTQITPGSVRIMAARFLSEPDTVICAGAVRNSLYGTPKYRSLSLPRKLLVLFQQLEYFRTFYMQRILFDRLNANIIVSGAFAMFDCSVLKAVGGYRTGTIGEDMELTMRLHAFCRSQGRPYRIAYAPEACCGTQVPYRYRDFWTQRRRWHIGMIQSLRSHAYMLGRRYYGWAGIIAGSFMLVYELFSPFVEILGLFTLISAYGLHILTPLFMIRAMLLYSAMILCSQMLLVLALRLCRVEPVKGGSFLSLFLISLLEFFLFHPLNILIKLASTMTRRKNKAAWGNIQRTKETAEP